jgi:hypothetical protein
MITIGTIISVASTPELIPFAGHARNVSGKNASPPLTWNCDPWSLQYH